MTDEMLNEEMKFLIKLKAIATQNLFEASMHNNSYSRGFDLPKAILVLKRAIDAEIEFLEDHPDDYLEIYG